MDRHPVYLTSNERTAYYASLMVMGASLVCVFGQAFMNAKRNRVIF